MQARRPGTNSKLSPCVGLEAEDNFKFQVLIPKSKIHHQCRYYEQLLMYRVRIFFQKLLMNDISLYILPSFRASSKQRSRQKNHCFGSIIDFHSIEQADLQLQFQHACRKFNNNRKQQQQQQQSHHTASQFMRPINAGDS